MKTTRILRIAAIMALIQFFAHTTMFLSAKPHHGPDEIAVIEAMKSQHLQLRWVHP